MPLDPQVEKILTEAAALGLPAYQELSPPEARIQMLDLAPPVEPLLAVKRVEDRSIPGPDGEIPIRLYYPAGDPPFATLAYFHGGGWVIGDLDTHHGFCHALAKKSGCLIVSVDYRLAPEHPYPAAVEDAYAATKWVAENAAVIQVDPDRFAVCGDSAGGHLATVRSRRGRVCSGGWAEISQELRLIISRSRGQWKYGETSVKKSQYIRISSFHYLHNGYNIHRSNNCLGHGSR